MKKITKFIMVLLSYAPIATVAVAAESKLAELEGDNQIFLMKKNMQEARHRLIPPYNVSTTMDAARIRYSLITGLQGDALENAMKFDLDMLSKSGLIRYNELKLDGVGPSEY